MRVGDKGEMRDSLARSDRMQTAQRRSLLTSSASARRRSETAHFRTPLVRTLT